MAKWCFDTNTSGEDIDVVKVFCKVDRAGVGWGGVGGEWMKYRNYPKIIKHTFQGLSLYNTNRTK